LEASGGLRAAPTSTTTTSQRYLNWEGTATGLRVFDIMPAVTPTPIT
jgi:hypothetical protein